VFQLQDQGTDSPRWGSILSPPEAARKQHLAVGCVSMQRGRGTRITVYNADGYLEKDDRNVYHVTGV